MHPEKERWGGGGRGRTFRCCLTLTLSLLFSTLAKTIFCFQRDSLRPWINYSPSSSLVNSLGHYYNSGKLVCKWNFSHASHNLSHQCTRTIARAGKSTNFGFLLLELLLEDLYSLFEWFIMVSEPSGGWTQRVHWTNQSIKGLGSVQKQPPSAQHNASESRSGCLSIFFFFFFNFLQSFFGRKRKRL